MTNLLSLITSFDYQVEHFFVTIRSPLLTQIFTLITALGAWYSITTITIAGTIFLIYKKKNDWIIPFLNSVLDASLTMYITKIYFHRQRPLDALITEKSFSFPSGHAMISVALYGFITYMLCQTITKKSHKRIIIITGTTLIFLIGLSRLILGVHYFSDIVGGYLIGTMWLMVGIALVKKN